jgi:glyoxylase-like metal-dependent hydrolase (beta-lactamase superfamily II)
MSVVVSWDEVRPLAVTGLPQRIVPLVLGYEPISEALSMRGGSAFSYLMEPVTAAAVVFERGWVLLDGGFDPARVRDDTVRRESFDYRNYTPIVPGDDPLVEQVAAAGLSWNHLAAAAISHAHFDHTGAARLLDPHQPLIVQAKEWEHVQTTPSERDAFLFRDDFDHVGLTLALIDGDVDLAPGLRALATPGHTPGHQSFAVTLPDRTVVLAGDAADLRRNLERRLPPGSVARENDAPLAETAIARLADLDARADTEVWPSHDPDWAPWRRVIDER